jgi:hypothetical protein
MPKLVGHTRCKFQVELLIASYPDKEGIVHPVINDAIRDAVRDALDNWLDHYEATFIDDQVAEKVIRIWVK